MDSQKQSTTPLDRKLDKLLSVSPITASPDFTDKTLALFHQERVDHTLGKIIDELLAQWPVGASSNFVEKTLVCLHAETKTKEARSVIAFSKVLSWIAAAAAVFAIGLFSLRFLLPTTSQTQSPLKVTVNSTPSHLERIELLMDEMDEVFLLTDALSETEVFLDDDTYETLSYLTID